MAFMVEHKTAINLLRQTQGCSAMMMWTSKCPLFFQKRRLQLLNLVSFTYVMNINDPFNVLLNAAG